MKLILKRDIIKPDFTLGILYVDGEEFCYTVEDTDRKLESGGIKIYGKTAIPRGTYEVEVTYSPKYNKPLPEIKHVPNYTGVRIHSGNTAADTEGCVIVGATRDIEKGVVTSSRLTMTALFNKINRAIELHESITLEII